MTDMFNNVKEFHEVFEILIGETPSFPDEQQRELRIKLLKEEFDEYLLGEENSDLENVAKELADIIYIACGTAVAYGIPLDKVFKEVHRSNMDKLVDGKVRRREDGKVLKPEGWQPPNISQFMV